MCIPKPLPSNFSYVTLLHRGRCIFIWANARLFGRVWENYTTKRLNNVRSKPNLYRTLHAMGSLKSFIKAVRKAKTIADERTVVKKESAAIRTSFRDASLDQNTRRINISKLLYLYIIGEKTHFGQVECIKLLASTRFADKRLGYLATMLLLDENQEVLTLLTNSLDNDMQHPNHFIVGLALNCLGNIASPELARDLYQNVERLITSKNPYLRKKACFVAARLIDKDPDLHEFFLETVFTLINDKSPGILLGTLRLVQALYMADVDCRAHLIKLTFKILTHLKRISSSGYTPEYDVVGITDPFLQVQLLGTLRLLATDPNCPNDFLDQFNDILTQVASNLEAGKNAAHAVLYECVRTIFAIQADQSLRILGVNILGKFLSTKDNNTRYVALDQLLNVMSIEPTAVQRHRSTIVACLLDGDISIRRRALELAFAILSEQNIRVLVREILQFLENCQDDELKTYITSQLTIAANKYAPNQKWFFDTIIRMLKLSANYVPSDIISIILALITQCQDVELKKHIVTMLLSSSLDDTSQFCLCLVSVWCIGEYADYISGASIELNGKSVPYTEELVLSLMDKLINNTSFSERETVDLVSYILVAAVKLSIKFTNPSSIEKLRLIISSRTSDRNIEIQTRAVEFQELFVENDQFKKGILAKMPAPHLKERSYLTLNNSEVRKTKDSSKDNGKSAQKSTTNDLLLDLMNDEVPANGAQDVGQAATSNDLLSDIFGTNSGSVSTKADSKTDKNDIMDLFSSPVSKGQATKDAVNAMTAYSDPSLTISFIPKSFPRDGSATLEALVKSKVENTAIEGFQLLIAVPKSQKLTMTSSSSDILTTSSPIVQSLRLNGPVGSKIKLRVKLKYHLNGTPEENMFDFSDFSDTL